MTQQWLALVRAIQDSLVRTALRPPVPTVAAVMASVMPIKLAVYAIQVLPEICAQIVTESITALIMGFVSGTATQAQRHSLPYVSVLADSPQMTAPWLHAQ